ncbi:hypothetical protein C8J56DRAFT_887074 [Mycena floridula]|nr:hypothetical protein C8J56DRAFT_887074 [Mycena floridula]
MKLTTISSLTVVLALAALSEAFPHPLDSITPCPDSIPSSSSVERRLDSTTPESESNEDRVKLERRDRYLSGYVPPSTTQPRDEAFVIVDTPLANRDDSDSESPGVSDSDSDSDDAVPLDDASDDATPTPVDLSPSQNAPSAVSTLHKSWKCQNFDSHKWSYLPLFRKSKSGLVQGGPIFKCRYVKDINHTELEHHTCTYKTKNGDPVWCKNSRRCPDHAKTFVFIVILSFAIEVWNGNLLLPSFLLVETPSARDSGLIPPSREYLTKPTRWKKETRKKELSNRCSVDMETDSFLFKLVFNHHPLSHLALNYLMKHSTTYSLNWECFTTLVFFQNPSEWHCIKAAVGMLPRR